MRVLISLLFLSFCCWEYLQAAVGNSTVAKPHPHMLTMSMSLLLAGALPPLYSRPQKAQSPSNSGVGRDTIGLSEMKYYVVQLKATQHKASIVCKTFGTELVSIPDARTNGIITNLILSSGERYWTSGRKLPNGKWIWWYQLPITYINWDIGQPKNSDKNQLCLQLLPSGEWNDKPCDTEQYFICEGSNVTSSC